MAPKISVLIPLYNRRQYAKSCIESVLRQSFSDFEIIIRDDCSTDGVFDFVRENFSDRRIKFLQNEKNRGEFITRNLLTKDAAGKYLTILHNDDFDNCKPLQEFSYEPRPAQKIEILADNRVILASAKLRLKISFERVILWQTS